MTAKKTQDSVESLLKAGKEQFETAVKASTQATQKGFEQAISASKKQLDDMIKVYDEVATFGRDNVDACLAASNAATRLVEEFNSEVTALSKQAYEANLAAYKAFAGVKTPKELFDLQSELVKSRYEDTLASFNKLNALFTSAANDAFAPLNARVAATMDKVSKAIA